MANMTDLKWIDITKGIGIILVILGHNNFNQFLLSLIFSFHMPMFFFINGYLFHYVKYKKDVRRFIHKKFIRLVVPYFITNIFFLCTYTLLYFCKLYPAFNGNSPIENLIGIFYGNGAPLNPPNMFTNQVNIPSWFLLGLFCASLLLYIIAYSHEKYGLPFSVFLSFLIILFGIKISKYIFLPWSFDIACVSMIFMFLGYLFNYHKVNLGKNVITRRFPSLASISLLLIVVLINGNVDMNGREYANIILFGIGGLLGTYITIEFAKKCSKYDNLLTKSFCFLGKNSLIIFLYQSFTAFLLLNFISLFFHIKDFIYSSPILNSFDMIIFSMLTVTIIKRIPILTRIYYIRHRLSN